MLRRATLRNPDERTPRAGDDRGPPEGNVRRGSALAPRSSKIPASLGAAFLVLGVAAGDIVVRWWRPLALRPALAVAPHPIPSKGPNIGPAPVPDRPKIVEPGGGKDAGAVAKEDSEHADDGNACLERGTQALSNRDFAAAVPDLEKAAKLIPGEAKVFSRLGAAWFGQKQWERAVQNYTKAIQIKPHPLDYQARGQAYRRLDKLDTAIADFRQSVELDATNAQAYADLGDIYLDKKDPQSAVQALSKAVQICRSGPNANCREFLALNLRASAYLDLGKNDDAAADLQRVFDLAQSAQDRESSHELFYALSLKLAEAKRYADAVGWIKKAIDYASDAATKNTYREALKTYSANSAPTSSFRQGP